MGKLYDIPGIRLYHAPRQWECVISSAGNFGIGTSKRGPLSAIWIAVVRYRNRAKAIASRTPTAAPPAEKGE